MAIALGVENKKQVYKLLALAGVVVVLLIYNFVGSGSSKKNTPPPTTIPTAKKPTATGPAGSTAANAASAGPAAMKLSGPNIDPALHLDKLAETEAIIYAGTGRNIFSADSVPTVTKMEAALAAARAYVAPVAPAPPPPPEAPKAPPIDLKYFGFTQNKDKSLRAFFTRGEDIFIAHTGEVVDHRYKVESIQTDSVRITDMSYNNTQTVPLTLK